MSKVKKVAKKSLDIIGLGGGDKPKAAPPPPDVEDVSGRVDDELRKLRAKKGFGSTVLTGSSGLLDDTENLRKKTLLG